MFRTLLDVFWVVLWVYLFFIWIWLLISIYSDIIRRDMSGVMKALWVLVMILFPIVGALVYLIVNGSDMNTRFARDAADVEAAQAEYIRSVATTSPADEIQKLAGLRDAGVLSEEEFQGQKAKLLS